MLQAARRLRATWHRLGTRATGAAAMPVAAAAPVAGRELPLLPVERRLQAAFEAPPFAALRLRFQNEMTAYNTTQEGAPEPPERVGSFEYFTTHRLGERPSYHRKAAAGGGSAVTVLDLNAFPSRYCSLGVMKMSPDSHQAWVAYTLDTDGSERYSLGVHRVAKAVPAARRRSAAVKSSRSNEEEVIQEGGRPRVPHSHDLCLPAGLHVGDAEWGVGDGTGDGSAFTLYYVAMHPTQLRGWQLWRTSVSSSTSTDTATPPSTLPRGELLLQEDDPSAYLSLSLSKDSRLLTASCTSRQHGVKVYVLEWKGDDGLVRASGPTEGVSEGEVTSPSLPPLRPLLGGSPTSTAPSHKYYLTHASPSQLLLVTDDASLLPATHPPIPPALAANLMLLAQPLEASTRGSCTQSWSMVLPPSPSARIDDIDVYGDKVVVYEAVFAAVGGGEQDGGEAGVVAAAGSPAGGTTRLRVVSLSDGSQQLIPTPSDTIQIHGGANADPSSRHMRFYASTATAPEVAVDVEVATGKVLRQVPKGVGVAPGRPLYVASDYVSYGLHFPSSEGVTVPVTVVHRSDLGLDPRQLQDTAARLRDAAARVAADVKTGKLPDLSNKAGRDGGSFPCLAEAVLSTAAAPWDDWREEPWLLGRPFIGVEAVTTKVFKLARVDPRSTSSSLPPTGAARWSASELGGVPRALLTGIRAHLAAAGVAAAPQIDTATIKAGVTASSPSLWRSATRLPSLLTQAFGSGGLAGTAREATATALAGGYPLPHQATHNNPALLTLYGAYGHALHPEFDPSSLPLLSRGWVRAWGHVRGGGEGGPAWHTAATGHGKHRSMQDAACIARGLAAVGLTRAGLLASRTESAGGILSGWLANKRPGLVKAHIARVPFLDVAAALSDACSGDQLRESEVAEWGDALSDPATAAYVACWCPLSNAPQGPVSATAFPAMLLVGAENDARVPPEHPLKYGRRVLGLEESGAGTLEAGAAGGRPLPLVVTRLLSNAGHWGGSDGQDRIAEAATDAAFLYTALGLPLDVSA